MVMVNVPVSGSSQQWLKGRRGIDIRSIRQTLSRWWMERSPCLSLLFSPGGWKMTLLLSLFNEHQALCVMHVFVRAHADRLQNKLGKPLVIVWIVHFIVFAHLSAATHCSQSSTHMHLRTHIACRGLSWCNFFLLYCFIPDAISLPGGQNPKMPRALIWINPSQ